MLKFKRSLARTLPPNSVSSILKVQSSDFSASFGFITPLRRTSRTDVLFVPRKAPKLAPGNSNWNPPPADCILTEKLNTNPLSWAENILCS